MVITLDDEHPCSFTQNRAVAVDVERATGQRRVFLAGEVFVQADAGQINRVDAGTTGSHDHHVGLITGDDAHRFLQSQESGRLSTGDRVVRSTGVVLDRHMAGWHVRQLTQEPEGSNPPHLVFAPASLCIVFVSDKVTSGVRQL